MQLVEKHIISKQHCYFKAIDHLCFLSKNLYNAALYQIRQHFFQTGAFLNYHVLQKQFSETTFSDYKDNKF